VRDRGVVRAAGGLARRVERHEHRARGHRPRSESELRAQPAHLVLGGRSEPGRVEDLESGGR
jgi:hypothetical protein